MLDRSTPPPVQTTSFTFRKPTERMMKCGTPIHIIEAAGSGAVRIDFVFSAGQCYQARKLQALFACRMLREGCRGYTAAQFAEQLDHYGAELELSIGMNSSFVTLYTLKKHFTPTLTLVHRMLTEPIYDEEQFRVVLASNKAQFLVKQQRGDVQAMRALRLSIYGNAHPCGIPTKAEDYDTLQVTDAATFHHHYYGSHTCQIYLSGDVDEALLTHVDTLFGSESWGATPSPSIHLDHTTLAPPPSTIHIPLEGAVQDSLCLGNTLMGINHPDYLSMRVLTTVLGGYFGSRLIKNLRETKGYTYHIGSTLINDTAQTLLLIRSEAQSGKAEEVIAEVRNEMRRLQEEPIADEELNMVRNYMLGELCRNYESAFALTDAYIYLDHLGLPYDHITHTIEAIRNTSAASLQQLAQQYLRPELLHCAVAHQA